VRPRALWHHKTGTWSFADELVLFDCPLMLHAWDVCRQDNSTGFSAEQCKLGAGGGILLERLMPEIAYKLGRAYKYGA
jgi:hypothetical protein